MKEIYQLKPNSIFEVGAEEVFFERDDSDHEDYINSGNLYEYYYAISKYYNPDTILEIGTRNGYSLYSLMLGSTTLKKVVGYELDEDLSAATKENLTPHLVMGAELDIQSLDSQAMDSLDESYRLVHIDGDKSYNGTYHDLELTIGKARVVVIGNFISEKSAREATLRFTYDHKDLIKRTHLIESHSGIYIIEYRG